MILKPEIEQDELQEALDYYLANCEHVTKVFCGSDFTEGCGELLALELQGGKGHYLDSRGVARVVLSKEMLSTRVRLDETPDGKPMVGYRCACGNDTIRSKAEDHHPPLNGWHTDLRPLEPSQIRVAIKLCGEHPAQYKAEGNLIHYESFHHEVIK